MLEHTATEDELRGKVEALEGERDMLEVQLTALNLKEEKETLKDQVAAMKVLPRERNTLLNVNTELQTLVDELTEAVVEWKGQVATLQSALAEQVSTLTRVNTGLERQVSELTDEVEQLKAAAL